MRCKEDGAQIISQKQSVVTALSRLRLSLTLLSKFSVIRKEAQSQLTREWLRVCVVSAALGRHETAPTDDITSRFSSPLPFSLSSLPLQSESSSSSNISTMLVTHDYTAVKEDEINVYQGEVVQILASNQQNMFLVFRAATDQCPAAEGWIPGFVLGHTSAVIVENPDGTLK